MLGALGAAAILWGSLSALTQTRLKMLVAYSTVAQIGYLFLLFPLATVAPPFAAEVALQGGVMQALAHGLAKAAMFAAAGSMISPPDATTSTAWAASARICHSRSSPSAWPASR